MSASGNRSAMRASSSERIIRSCVAHAVDSHRTTSTCRSVAEWRRASEQSREDMEKRRSLGDRLPQENADGSMGFHGNRH